MSLQKHARRHTQRAFDETSRYGAPPGWVTPEIAPGYFNNTGRFQDTPESSEARTGSSMQQTPISGNTSFATAGLQQGQQFPQQQMFSFPSACRKARTHRLPPVAPSTSIIRAAKAVATGRPCQRDRNFGHSSRFQSTRYEPYRQEQPHNESEGRRPYNERRRASSTLLPPRDALLHVPRVTPPAPIHQGEQQTPEAAQSYTHVSIHIEKKHTSTVHTMVL
jgi:hypothetical protein